MSKEEIIKLANEIWPSDTDGTYNDLTKNFPHYRYGFIQALEYYSQFKQDKQSDAVEFAEWLLQNAGVAEDDYYYVSLKDLKYITTQELFTLFKDEQLKKK